MRELKHSDLGVVAGGLESLEAKEARQAREDLQDFLAAGGTFYYDSDNNMLFADRGGDGYIGVGDGGFFLDSLGPMTSTGGGGDGGGWFVNFGLGLGGGFNLTFSSNGVDASVGAGIWGTLEVGYATTDEALIEEGQKNEVFADASVAKGALDVGAEYDWKTNDYSLTIGPVTASNDGAGFEVSDGIKLSASPDTYSFGLDAGFGVRSYVGSNDWNIP